MKRIAFTVCCLLALIGFSRCNNENEYLTQNEQENNLTLIAPNGMRIASSLHSLKEETAVIIAEQFGDDLKFTITDIQYTPVREGYLALISYELENGQPGNFAHTNSSEIINNTLVDMAVFDLPNDTNWQLNEEGTMLYTTSRQIP